VSIDELPEIITAQHIADYLGISRGKVYVLFQTKPTAGGIPSFDIGASRRVDKQDFLSWIDARKGEKAHSLAG
jgi:excisionase family DNA binding protein